MKVEMSLIKEFEELWTGYANDPVKSKYLAIEGISPDNLDIGLQSENFFKEKLADITTDANSNYSENMNPTVYRTHTSNGQMKLLGYHLLWYYAMRRYGIDWANKVIGMIWEGYFYFHDAHGLRIQMPYCYAFSLDKIVFEGRPYGSSPTTPPKHKKSFLSQVDKLISDLSKQFAGATAPSDLFLWYSWYLMKWLSESAKSRDWKEYIGYLKDEIVDDMQGLVCLFNEPGRAEGEPPFTNISIYDPIGLQNLFEHITFPDGTKPDFEFIMFIQKTFCEWFSHGDPITGFPYRFPVVTINITTNKSHDFENEEFARWVAHVDRNMCNFNLHFGDKSKVAMCSYHPDVEVLTQVGWKFIKDVTKDDTIITVNADTKEIEYYNPTYLHHYQHDGVLHHYYDNSRKFDLMVTPNHEMLCVSNTCNGIDNWKFLKSEDFGTSQALIRKKPFYKGNVDIFGKLLGFYIGDGYYSTTEDIVKFNLKKQRKIEYLENLCQDLNIQIVRGNADKNGMTAFTIHSSELLEYARVLGKAQDKYIPIEVMQSEAMMAGVLDGLMNSDGNWNSNRYWTTSERLRDDVMAIACMLGYQPWYYQFDRETKMRGKTYHNGTYEIKLLVVNTLTHAKSKRDDVPYNGDVYCIDVPNHIMFVRQNGVATLSSNCRYENDLSDMNLTPDSFGNGGVNIGSHRVVTPNFVRCALDAGCDPEKFIENCDELIDIAGKLLHIHRLDILQKRIDETPQYLQFFGSLGWFSLDTMFSTIGLTGIHEVCQYMGYDILSDEGTDFTLDFMKYLNSKVKELRSTYGCTFNCEEIPGEQACVSLLDKDHIFFDNKDMSNVPDDIKDTFNNCKLYSNQYIPLINQADMITRLDLSSRFMNMISGGGIVHINSEAQIDTDDKMYELIKFGAKCGCPHFAICYRFGKCVDHPAIIVGQNRSTCPICGKPITHTRARVIGYFSDEHNWHPVRQKFDAPYRYYSSGNEIE